MTRAILVAGKKSVHQAIAPIVGRADLLCGFFSVAALILARRRRSTSHRGIGTSGGERIAVKAPPTEPVAGGAKTPVVKEARGDPGHAEGNTEGTVPGPAKVSTGGDRCESGDDAHADVKTREGRGIGSRELKASFL